MTGYLGRAPRPGSGERLDLEQAIARGVPNHQLMVEFGISYESLRNVIDGMNDEPTPLQHAKVRPTSVKPARAALTPGQEALREAARMETARVYGRLARDEERAHALLRTDTPAVDGGQVTDLAAARRRRRRSA